MRLRDIIELLEKKYIDEKGLDRIDVEWYLRQLYSVNSYLIDLERDKAAAEAMVTVWKESYLDQVRENVKLQAKAFTGVAGKYEDKHGDEVDDLMSRLNEKEKENWRVFISKLIKELDRE